MPTLTAPPLPLGAPELAVAKDLAKRGVYAAPVLLALCALFWRGDGALSSGYALGIVLVNFLLAAGAMALAARISLVVLMATVMGSYVVRLVLIAGALWFASGRAWFEPVPLCLTLVVAHLGLLAWEVRYVSASLAFPALKPSTSSQRSRKELSAR